MRGVTAVKKSSVLFFSALLVTGDLQDDCSQDSYIEKLSFVLRDLQWIPATTSLSIVEQPSARGKELLMTTKNTTCN